MPLHTMGRSEGNVGRSVLSCLGFLGIELRSRALSYAEAVSQAPTPPQRQGLFVVLAYLELTESSCLSLPSAGSKSIRHHCLAHPLFVFMLLPL